MSIKIATNAGDPPPRVQVWVDVEPYLTELGRAEAATQRYLLNDTVEAEPDRRELIGPPAPHRSWACVNRNHEVCPAARIDCSCRCHLA